MSARQMRKRSVRIEPGKEKTEIELQKFVQTGAEISSG
jgi:hypothetical protein